MKVLVIGLNGLGLSPTSPRKARILVDQGKAERVKLKPYTIKLLFKTGCVGGPIDVGVDTGSQNIGIAVKAHDKILDKGEWHLRSSMEKRKLIEGRKERRSLRRYRKTPYRRPKFKFHTKRVYVEKPVKRNGHLTHWEKAKIHICSSRPQGWLPPSLQSKVDHHIAIINAYRMALPKDATLKIEVGRFDIAKIKDPSLQGEDYQRGRMYQQENVRAYVFDRDGYKCQVCKKKAGTKRKDGSIVKLRTHHIDFKSRGATDNPDRMITVCNCCHTAAAHRPGGILYQWMVEGKTMRRGYRDMTMMNILRRRMWKAFPDAIFTYGNITKVDREKLGLEKSHANDAVAIACKGEDRESVIDIEQTVMYRQLRKKKRSLHESIPRKGRKEPNRTAKRNNKNTVRSGKFTICDKVIVDGKTGWITGFSGERAYIKDIFGEYVTISNKYMQIANSKLKFVTHNNGWAVQPIASVSHD